MEKERLGQGALMVAYVWKSGDVTLEPPQALIPHPHLLINRQERVPATDGPLPMTVLQAAEINAGYHHQNQEVYRWIKVWEA